MDLKKFNTNIELSNSGQLSLFFIGTGYAFTKKYFQTNLFVIKGSDYFLIDCGTLCPFALKQAYNTDIGDIKNILISHPHADHIGGIEELALTGRYIKKNKINIIIPAFMKKKLWNESLRGGLQFSEDGKLRFEDYFKGIYPEKIQHKPFDIYELQFGSINVKMFRTRHVTSYANSLRHSQPSFGVILDNKILFTADTQFNPNQLNYLLDNYNIETIFHDCDTSGFSGGVHATYEQLCTLDDDIKSKMYLCHYNDRGEKPDSVADGFAGYTEAGVYYSFN